MQDRKLKNYVLINTAELFQEALDHINNNEFIAYDTESTGLNVRKDTVIGFGFTGEVGVGYYYPILKYDLELGGMVNAEPSGVDFGELLDAMKGKKLLMHNASYDIRITANNLGVNYLGSLHADTQLMEHTLDEESEVALKKLAEKYKVELGLDDQDASNQEQLALAESVKRNGGKWLKGQKDIFMGDMELIGYYCCADVDMTLRLFKFLEARLLAEKLHDFHYAEEVLDLCKFNTIRMEARGLYLAMSTTIRYNLEITNRIKELEKEVVEALLATDAGKQFVEDRIKEEFSPKNTGGFAQAICNHYGLDLPKTAAGKFSITKKTVAGLATTGTKQDDATLFLQTGDATVLDDIDVKEIQLKLLKESDDSDSYINIGSKHHLGKIVFDLMGILPLTKTAKGSPQFNEDFVEHIAEEYGFSWAKRLRVYNKLVKIKGTNYERFLNEQEDGIFYPTFKQHGTTSGRYSSNLQQLSRPLEEGSDDPDIVYFTNVIRELFIPKQGYVFVDTDYESLEPRIFADDAGDQALIDIFENNLDLYSVVAIMALGLTGVSADKSASNFLKKLYPDHRQNAKVYALGLRYGMKAGKLAMTLGIENGEAQKIIDNYFRAFPKLKAKMDGYLREVKTTGKVTSKFGRVRHLPEAKAIYDKFGDGILDYKKMGAIAKRHGMSFQEIKDIRKQYNGILNNALNFPIQAAAASIVNRAMIAMTKEFMAQGLDAWVSLQLHDQIVVTCHESCVAKVKEIVQNSMENTNKLAMPLIAVPAVGRNLREAH